MVTDADQWQGALVLRCSVQFPKKGLGGATLTAQGAYSIFKDTTEHMKNAIFTFSVKAKILFLLF